MNKLHSTLQAPDGLKVVSLEYDGSGRVTKGTVKAWQPGEDIPSHRMECRHRGPDPIDEAECRTCGGNVRLKVYPCGIHQRCTIGKRIDDAACCAICTEYTP